MKLATQTRYYLSISSKLQFLHYFRHLLREISYLPDPVVRKYHHDNVLRRFREYRPVGQPWQWGYKAKRITDEDHLKKKLETCQDQLSWLYRAANGDYKALSKAIWMAYGRVGRRKHILLAPYVDQDVPKDAQELEKTLSAWSTTQPQLPKAIVAMIQEQSKQPGQFLSTTEKKVKKYTQPVLPEINMWNRPMPKKRIYNTKRKLFSQMLKRVYPPLPLAEFQRIQDLATGALPCPTIPKRRTRLPGLPQLPEMTANHQYTPRTMQRLWARLVPFCSTMTHDEQTGKYKVSWGPAKSIPPEKLRASEEEAYLFEGARTIR